MPLHLAPSSYAKTVSRSGALLTAVAGVVLLIAGLLPSEARLVPGACALFAPGLSLLVVLQLERSAEWPIVACLGGLLSLALDGLFALVLFVVHVPIRALSLGIVMCLFELVCAAIMLRRGNSGHGDEPDAVSEADRDRRGAVGLQTAQLPPVRAALGALIGVVVIAGAVTGVHQVMTPSPGPPFISMTFSPTVSSAPLAVMVGQTRTVSTGLMIESHDGPPRPVQVVSLVDGHQRSVQTVVPGARGMSLKISDRIVEATRCTHQIEFEARSGRAAAAVTRYVGSGRTC